MLQNGPSILTPASSKKRRTAIQLHEMGPKLVVITSYQLPDLPEALTLLAMKVPDSLPEGCLRGGLEFVRISMPRIPGYYTGTGDFVAACILAWTHILPDDLPQSLLRAVSAMQAVLQRTGYEPGGIGLDIRCLLLLLMSSSL